MATSQARIDANRKNALQSRGPTSREGREKSRANALKHGLTGSGVVMSEADAAEVARLSEVYRSDLTDSYRKEMGAPGEVGDVLVRRMAIDTVRMDRCVERESAAIAANVRKALAEFVPPEGASPLEVAKLRAEVKAMAQFDPSKEAGLVRKYEAAAERSFFRAMKEIQNLKRDAAKQAKAEAPPAAAKPKVPLGSFSPKPANPPQATPAEVVEAPRPPSAPPARPVEDLRASDVARRAALRHLEPTSIGSSYVPISIGKPR